jgi:predicted DNA-binding antitoxin AbrB/MazE fold protein
MTFHGRIENGVAVLDQPVTLPEGTRVRVEVEPAESEFLSAKSVEELAREQGIVAVTNVADLTIDWPEEESVDEFLAPVREVRQ